MALLNDLYQIGNTIDTFALGHYARVYEGLDKRDGRQVAFKVMRLEHVVTGDAEPRMEAVAFVNEADLLTRMALSPHVVRLYDCGYLSARDENPRGGEIESYGLNVELFRQGIFRYAGRGWRPYLALEPLPRTDSLLYVMKPNTNGVRWRLPTEEGIDLAYQFAEVLALAHRQRIVYLDHKLEHVYWDGRQLKVIDWNSSRLIEGGGQALAQKIADDLHNLCVGILYPVFTGLSPQKGALVAQPADQLGVESRYKDITTLDFAVEPTLSQGIQKWLQQGAQRAYSSLEQFRAALGKAAAAFGWETGFSSAALRAARTDMRDGLAKLRQGQAALREARDLLRDAVTIEDIGEDLEAELRRLLSKINEMLQYRVIP